MGDELDRAEDGADLYWSKNRGFMSRRVGGTSTRISRVRGWLKSIRKYFALCTLVEVEGVETIYACVLRNVWRDLPGPASV